MVDEREHEPRCKGTRRDGAPCGAWQQLDDEGLCRVHSHSSRFDPVETGRRAGLRSGTVRREQAKSVRERLREKVEAEIDLVWAAYAGALEAVGADGAPDHRARYQAASALLAESYGKPVQPTLDQGGVQFVIEGRPPRDPTTSRGYDRQADERLTGTSSDSRLRPPEVVSP